MAMRPFMLNQPVIEALIARMQSAALTTALSEITAAVSPKYAGMLAAPQQVLPYAPPPSMLVKFPTIGIVDADSEIEDDTGSSATGRHDVGVVVYLSNPDPDLLAWGLRFYLQAIARTALAGRNLGTGSADGAWGTVARRVVPGPGFLQDEDPAGKVRTMMWSTFVISAKREEIE